MQTSSFRKEAGMPPLPSCMKPGSGDDASEQRHLVIHVNLG